jgi:transposase InsO family protein
MAWKETLKMNQRIEFAMRAVSAESFSELCREYGISRKTGYKWRERFVSHGVAGMEDESRRPHSHAAELGEDVVCRIVRLKAAHKHWGARKIRELYRRKHGGDLPSESSFKRVFERAGLTEKRRRQRREQSGRLEAGVEVTGPNDLWTVDFKGWWRGGEGRRIEPLTVRDAHSRYILEMHMVENAKTETVGARFERLFEAHGLPGAIRSDNGSPFACAHSLLGLTRLSAWWLALGIDLVRGRPGCPQDNGGHERMHLDIFRELERGRAGTDQESFDLWRQEFNTERPHEALGMAMPAEVYSPSARAFEGTPEAIDYGPMETRKVTRQGTIGYGGDYIMISTALRHWNVGVSPCDDGNVEVWFAKLLVGHIDPKAAAFRPTTPPPKRSPSRSASASFWPSPLRSEGQKDAPLTTQPKPKKL